MPYRAATVREMQRTWDKERRFYLSKIDDLLAALLVASGKSVTEQLMPPFEPTRFSPEDLDAIDDFVPPLEVYDLN